MSLIESTDKCIQCDEFEPVGHCLKNEKDPKKCKRTIPYFAHCPRCGKEHTGRREYWKQPRIQFECSCGQRFSVMWQDEELK